MSRGWSGLAAALVIGGWGVAGAGGTGSLGPGAGEARGGGSGRTAPAQAPDVDRSPSSEGSYDGRFTFVRIRFESGGRSMRRGWFGRGGGPLWAHDTPRAEQNFTRILKETTFVDPYDEGTSGRVLALDDPELFKYPVAYIVEVGYWQPTPAEVEGLRSYLRKGGFLIVDDFRGGDLRNFEAQMRRVLPGARILPLAADHRIFDSFFRIEDPESLAPPTYPQFPPMYLGIFEENDPSKRLMAVINYNNDIAEYWEYSDRGYYPIDLSNEAYKYGVNYIIYAMTH